MKFSAPQSPGEYDGSEPRPRRSLAARAVERTTARQQSFLKALGEVGTVTAACTESRVGKRTVYDWIERDAQFANEFNLARDAAADVLEAEARRRGVHGVPEPVFFQGAVIGHVLKYSDACLLALLSAYRPERFKRRGVGAPSEQSNQAAVHVSYDHNLEPAGSD